MGTNLIREVYISESLYAIPDDGKDKTHVVCIDSDLKGSVN